MHLKSGPFIVSSLAAAVSLALAAPAVAAHPGLTARPQAANTKAPSNMSGAAAQPGPQASQGTKLQGRAQTTDEQAPRDTPTGFDARKTPNQEAGQEASANATSLPTVVVTATRRSQAVQDVPGQVTSLTGDFLDQINARDFGQFASFVPGLSYDSLGPTSDLVAIRGVTTGGTQLSSGIAMYLGQVPIGSSTPFGVGFQTFPVSTFDLARVEVLNGPQGTLYGANALGGAIKYIPVSPNLDAFGALVSGSLSSTAHAGESHGVNAMVNVPLVPGEIALRVDGVKNYQTGFGHNTLLGTGNKGSSRTTMGRAQLLAQFTPDLGLKLSAFQQKIRGNGLNVGFRDIQTSRPTQGAYEQQFIVPQTESNSLHVLSAIVHWKLPWAKFTSVSAYQRNNGTSYSDLSDMYNVVFHGAFGFPLTTYGFLVDTPTKKTTQELRLESPQGQRFEWLVGVYGAHEKTHEIVDLQNRAGAGGSLLGFSPFFGSLPSVYKERSVFVDGTYHFTDKFDLMLGARYSHNNQRYQQFAHGWLVVPTAPGETTHQDASSTQNVATWLFNPSYHVNEGLMLYAKVASGYRPGGPNFALQLGEGAPAFKPDKLWSYEIGEKATLLNHRLEFNADIYDIEWSRIQLTVNNNGVNQIVNGGTARVKGAELNTAFKATPHLTVTANGAWTDAKLTAPVPALGLADGGARLPLSARFNAAVAASYDFSVGSRSSAEITLSDAWVGSRTAGYKGSLVAPYYHLPAYNIMNLDFTLFAPHGFRIDAFAHNVFDKAGQVSATTIANQYDPFAPVPVVLAQPRTVGVRVSFSMGSVF